MEEIKVNEIRVNDYVRTKEGLLFKVNEYWYYECLPKLDENVRNRLKAKPNIIDLIEVGDILEIEEDGIKGCMGWDKETTTLSYKDMIEDIKKGDVKLLGIVTRQQFNSIKYEVE